MSRCNRSSHCRQFAREAQMPLRASPRFDFMGTNDIPAADRSNTFNPRLCGYYTHRCCRPARQKSTVAVRARSWLILDIQTQKLSQCSRLTRLASNGPNTIFPTNPRGQLNSRGASANQKACTITIPVEQITLHRGPGRCPSQKSHPPH